MTERRRVQLRVIRERKLEADNWHKTHRPAMQLKDYKCCLREPVGKTFQLSEGGEGTRTYTVEKLYPFFVQCRTRAKTGGFTWLESFSYPEIYSFIRRGGM